MKEFLIEELYDRGLIPYDESIVLAEGFEDAMIGVTTTTPNRAVYDYWKCLDCLIKAKVNSKVFEFDAALEWLNDYIDEANDSDINSFTPIFIKTL
mgnify:FL=1|jgi:hypothetical protein